MDKLWFIKQVKQLFVSLVLYVRYYMNVWDVAVLELDSHPDHNKGPTRSPCAWRKTDLLHSS